MKRLILLFLVLIPVAVWAASPATPGDTDETAFGDIVGPGASADEVLAAGSYVEVDVLNDSDCDVSLTFSDLTGSPSLVIPAGTSLTYSPGQAGLYVSSAADLAYMDGETCSSGSVYVQGTK